jgi:hypothetical protein
VPDLGEPLGWHAQDLALFLKRGRHHPEEREEHDRTTGKQQDVQEKPIRPLPKEISIDSGGVAAGLDLTTPLKISGLQAPSSPVSWFYSIAKGEKRNNRTLTDARFTMRRVDRPLARARIDKPEEQVRVIRINRY